jgi:PPM family protein phosphatase
MSLVVRAAVITDPGLVRTNNEDAVYAGRQLFAVADGIGGLPAGEVASEIVIRALTALDERFHGADRPPADAAQRSPQSSGRNQEAEPLSALRKAVNEANDEIRRVAKSDPANDGMGTTVTALLLSGDQFGLLHIGDSRAYLLREGVLSQLTRDDTYVQVLVDQGVLTAEGARNHPQRSLVTRAVHGEHIAPTCQMVPVRGGDRYLLCSDGLSDFVADSAIGQTLLSYPESPECAEQLVKLALQAGAPDNVTVLVADVTDATDVAG